MLVLERTRQHDDLACASRRQRKPALRRADVSLPPKRPAEPADLDAQPRAIRFIGDLPPEGALDEYISRHVVRPRLPQGARESEQHRTPRQRDRRACVTHGIAALVHDERVGTEQRFDLLEPEEPLLAVRDQTRRGSVQDEEGAFDLRRQRWNARVARGALGPGQRSTRRLRPEAPHRDPGNDEFVGDPRPRREGRGVEPGERTLGLLAAADQQEAERALAGDRKSTRLNSSHEWSSY